MKAVLRTHAFKGTAGVLLGCLFIGFPPALSWLVALAAIVFSAGQFREAFRQIDAEAAKRREGDPPGVVTTLDIAGLGELCPAVAVNQESATPATPGARFRLPA